MNKRILFAQAGPRLGNQFKEDRSLQHYLSLYLQDLPATQRKEVTSDLNHFGGLVGGPYMEHAKNAELFKPELEKYDAWGNPINKLHLSEGWKFFAGASAKEGLIAIPYEQQFGALSRVYQAAKLFMFSPSGGLFGCPLAMTDGAAFVLRSIDRQATDPSASLVRTIPDLKEAYDNLRSRDPEKFWTSGQWMTEKRGGSDVSAATDTVAVPLKGNNDEPGSRYSLHGYKWFTSATDSQMSLTLARVADHKDSEPSFRRENDAKVDAADDRVSMFYVRMRTHPSDETEGQEVLNNIEIIRTKDKMGTRQLPTAELILDGTEATLLSTRTKGINMIANMINITRFHNAIAACAGMRRMVNLAIDFAHRRTAFGAKIAHQPLHVDTLVSMDFDARGNLLMVLEISRLLGLVDAECATERDSDLIRIITPLLKLFTAKEAIAVCSEGIECFGGVGYMENSHIPAIFRDAQVLPIWEGTTNILSLDLLRVLQREPTAVKHLFDFLQNDCLGVAQQNKAVNPDLLTQLGQSVETTANFMLNASPDELHWNARKLSMNLSRIIVASLCAKVCAMSKAAVEPNPTAAAEDVLVFQHWVGRVLRQNDTLSSQASDISNEAKLNVIRTYEQEANMGANREVTGDRAWRSRL